MKTLARHVIAELYECDEALIAEVEPVRAAMLEAARLIGATVVGEAFHRFSPHGVSGTVVIAESHISIHTWPERGYAAVDLFTCGGLDPRPGCDYLKRALGASSGRLQEILRGLADELADHDAALLPADVQVISRTGVIW